MQDIQVLISLEAVAALVKAADGVHNKTGGTCVLQLFIFAVYMVLF